MDLDNNQTKVLRVSSIVDVPSAIESLNAINEDNLLAVGRSDDTIELWNTNTWIQLIKINGLRGKNFPQILESGIKRVFLIKKKQTDYLFENLRLFSIGLNGYLIEWSFNTMNPKVFLKIISAILSKSRRSNLGLRPLF